MDIAERLLDIRRQSVTDTVVALDGDKVKRASVAIILRPPPFNTDSVVNSSPDPSLESILLPLKKSHSDGWTVLYIQRATVEHDRWSGHVRTALYS